MKGIFPIILTAIVITSCRAAWQENVRPKMYVQLGELKFSFRMNIVVQNCPIIKINGIVVIIRSAIYFYLEL